MRGRLSFPCSVWLCNAVKIDILYVRLPLRQTRTLWQNKRTYYQYSDTVWKANSTGFVIPTVVDGAVHFHVKFWMQSDPPLIKLSIAYKTSRYSANFRLKTRGRTCCIRVAIMLVLQTDERQTTSFWWQDELCNAVATFGYKRINIDEDAT